MILHFLKCFSKYIQIQRIKRDEGGEAVVVVLKIQVRKDEIIYGMFPEMTIEDKTFDMDVLIKKHEETPPKITKSEKCLDTGEQEDVSQINFQSVVPIINFSATLHIMPFGVENEEGKRWDHT